MPDRFARTFGATAILATIVVAGLVQFANADTNLTAVELVGEAPPAGQETATTRIGSLSTANLEPFVYRIGILQGPSTQNFWEYSAKSNSVWDAYVLAPTKAGLFKLDGRTLELQPELADSIADPTWNATGWRVVVSLKRDMRWNDGNQITARDFSFTFESVRRLNLGGSWATAFPQTVESVKALDDTTLSIEFSERPGLETWPYAVGTAPVMAAHYWESRVEAVDSASDLYELDGSGDVASGPLHIVEVLDDRVVSRPNPGYTPIMTEILEYHVYEDELALTEALVAGEVHTALTPKGVTDANAARLSAEGVATVETDTFGLRYIGFNLNREPMDSLAFREAVAYLIDRAAMAGEFAPSATVAETVMPATNSFWFDEDMASEISALRDGTIKQRLGRAIKGLRGAGYTWDEEPSFGDDEIVAGTGLKINGVKPAPLTILTPGDVYDPARSQYAEAIAQRIELLGFSVIPVPTDFSTVVDLAFTADEGGHRQYDMVLLGWSLGNPSYPSFYAELFGTDGNANNTGYSKPKMDRLIEDLHKATTVGEARQLIWKIEAMVNRDLPYLSLYSAQITEAYRADLVELDINGILGGIHSSLGGFEFATPLQ